MASALLLPSFNYLDRLSTSPSSLRSFIRAFLLPKGQDLNKMHNVLPERSRKNMIRDEDPNLRKSLDPLRVDTPIVLICGHKGRDQRCGVMGPLLEEEFRTGLRRAGFTVPGAGELVIGKSERRGEARTANVGLISHIGGHKFAGNVIVYLPSRSRLDHGEAEERSQLAGTGTWYGRVEPRHVEGIIWETILNGRIIQELFRGGVGADGEVLGSH